MPDRPKCARCGAGMDAWGCVKCGGDLARLRPKKVEVPPFEPGHGRPDLDMLYRVLHLLDMGHEPLEIRHDVATYINNRRDDRGKT